MIARLHLILFALVAAVAGTDVVWAASGHFDIDTHAYGGLAVLAAVLAAGGQY